MSAFVACAQKVSAPSVAIQNASTAEKSGTPAPLNANTAEVPSPDLKPLSLPPVNVAESTKQIFDHLDLATRYYRAIAAPLQTVGEPDDVLYREEAVNDAKMIAADAFKAARAEAVLLAASAPNNPANSSSAHKDVEKQQIAEVRDRVRHEIAASHLKMNSIDGALTGGGKAQFGILLANKKKLQQYLDFENGILATLDQVETGSGGDEGSGLAGDIGRLERTIPDIVDPNIKVPTVPLSDLGNIKASGITSQVQALFQLMTTRSELRSRLRETEVLRREAQHLLVPVASAAHSLETKGQQLSDLTKAPSDAGDADDNKQFQSLMQAFNAMKSEGVPLGQELLALEQSRANLTVWQTAVESEYRNLLRALLIRLSVIGGSLCLLFGVSHVWERATTQYVHDTRRRRQLMGMRRVIIGAFCLLVVLFGFTTQFKSLTTFAAFITAGLAVGLQAILLSVAAYSFIIGRFGIRVGDRITVSNVTGDVINVGLVRFYLAEMAGTGPEMYSTGRVAVFSNAVLFQAGTPLYKQVPGTDYKWHEMTIKLLPEAGHHRAAEAITKVVCTIYAEYREEVEAQSRSVEQWTDMWSGLPDVESILQFQEDGFQLLVRYPVKLRLASKIDQTVIEALLVLIENNEEMKQATSSLPVIRSAVKG
jgi:hypothetical protein